MQTELEMAVSAVVADWSGARYVNGSNESLEGYMTKERVESNMNTADYNLKEFELNTENGVIVGYKDKDYNFTVEITSSGNSAKVIYEGNSEGSSGGSGSDEENPPIDIDYEYGDVESYGDYVEYSIDLNGDGDITNDWRIFYNDGTNIFIIAADYVESDSEFLDLTTAEMYRVANTSYESDYIYSLNWYNSGSSTLTNSGHSSISSEVASLFMYNKYYAQNPTSNGINAQATSAMLNQSAWDGFKDNNSFADYAIGGPTIEMWVASYNANGYTPLYTNVNNTGYYIGNVEDTTSSFYDLEDDANNGCSNTLYFPYQTTKNDCNGYWLSSPCAVDPSVMMAVGLGSLGSTSYNITLYSVRPVVCLNSEVTATQDESTGVWKLSKP